MTTPKRSKPRTLATASNSKERDQLILHSLNAFYADETNAKTLLSVLFKRSKISLRALDFLVTNYSKRYGCSYIMTNGSTCNIFQAYKNCLKSFSKKDLDPFCRRERTLYDIYDPVEGKTVSLLTTRGQLNFFRFVIEKEIMQYAQKHIESIESYMFTKNPKRQKSMKRKASGVETSGSPSSSEPPNLELQTMSLSPSSTSPPTYQGVRGKTVMPSATAIKVKKGLVIKFG